MKFLIIAVVGLASLCGAEDLSGDRKDLVENINRRYDDFFRYLEWREERLERLDESRGQRKAKIRARKERLERARQKYVQARREAPSNEDLRARWEAEQADRDRQMEMLRERYVKKRDDLEQYLLKGRKIPELKEYDLEGY